MIERTFTADSGTLVVVVRVYPPSPTVWLWLASPGRRLRDPMETPSVRRLRRWVVTKMRKTMLRTVLYGGAGAAQDLCVDLLRVLTEIEGEFARKVA